MSKFCQNCGAEMKDDTTFCGMCGTRLDSGDTGANRQSPTVDVNASASSQYGNPYGQSAGSNSYGNQYGQSAGPNSYGNQYGQSAGSNPYGNQYGQSTGSNQYGNQYGQSTGTSPYANQYGQPFNPYQNMMPGARMSEKQFYDTFASNGIKSSVIVTAVIAYLSAGVSLLYGIVMEDISLALVDVIFYGIISTLLLTQKKWGYALAIAIYGIVFSLIGLIVSGMFTGIVAIIFSITAAVNLKKMSKAYSFYLATGQLPIGEVR